ncbi:aspartyl/glutamyl-tRNA(Asn/Gln) amidotransferase subunit A [Alicyclobacillus sacchari]|uniref:Aspartyl/glutamyl-tRNA(Asn/Gln) amidotransferase subunit A n=1 Tax=Alicyclobacillus sacchari TaxID=392010 RepID=A0A4R8LQ71_9BACL|nr:amidase [Alicyclobacillus sacchari]TDY46603.1 aspartyl/glutamyl-tRNA(Asn/Gln) amidotransferase subunit A [Alicyclobacillus sacchari]
MTQDQSPRSVVQLRTALAERSLTAAANIAGYLRRIERQNETLRAYLHVCTDRAQREAMALDALASGFPEALGPLAGVPVSVKDLIDTSFAPTTYGQAKYREHQPQTTAVCVQRLQSAHAIVLGKAHLHEFAFGVTNENPHFGSARNPLDPTRITGGSSGGSAASVAAGMALVSVGTDTGGSVRIPAAFTGVVGLKPTFGAIPTDGVYPLAPSLDHVGSFANTVLDAARVAEVMAGLAPGTWSQGQTEADQIRPMAAGLVQSLVDAYASQRVAEWFSNMCTLLSREGLIRVAGEVPVDGGQIAIHQGNILGAEAYATHAQSLADHPADYGSDVLARLQAGHDVPTTDYIASRTFQENFQAEMDRYLQRYDCFLLPTVPIPAPPLGATTVTVRGKEEAVRPLLTRFTNPWNLAGLPAISIPAGNVDGLPMGLQIIGPRGQDAKLVHMAHVVETALQKL